MKKIAINKKSQVKLVVRFLLLGCFCWLLASHIRVVNTKEIRAVENGLELHFIDVGQADCILIKADGEYMLIDTGNNGDEHVVFEYLENENIDRLDYLIATHPHEDHIGGMDQVIKAVPVENMIISYQTHTTKSYEQMLDTIEQMKVNVMPVQQFQEISLGKGKFTILTPQEGDFGAEINDYSVGIKLEYGARTFILTGDAGQLLEKEITDTSIDISADLLKLNHHGSKDASSELFLDCVKPRYAVISCGTDNEYGHPHKTVMKRLKERGIQVFRTDIQGTIIISSDGENLSSNVKPIVVE